MTKVGMKARDVIEDGSHSGRIEKFEQYQTPQKYNYIRFFIKVDGTDITIRHSMPDNPTTDMKGKPLTELAKFLKAVGCNVSDLNLDYEKHVVGKRLVFTTFNKESEKGGSFAEIIPESIKSA